MLAGGDAKDAFGRDGLIDALKKALAERALNAEMDHHLATGEPDGSANSRNGFGAKTVLTDTGPLELQVPRDRLASFDPARARQRVSWTQGCGRLRPHLGTSEQGAGFPCRERPASPLGFAPTSSCRTLDAMSRRSQIQIVRAGLPVISPTLLRTGLHRARLRR